MKAQAWLKGAACSLVAMLARSPSKAIGRTAIDHGAGIARIGNSTAETRNSRKGGIADLEHEHTKGTEIENANGKGRKDAKDVEPNDFLRTLARFALCVFFPRVSYWV